MSLLRPLIYLSHIVNKVDITTQIFEIFFSLSAEHAGYKPLSVCAHLPKSIVLIIANITIISTHKLVQGRANNNNINKKKVS